MALRGGQPGFLRGVCRNLWRDIESPTFTLIINRNELPL